MLHPAQVDLPATDADDPRIGHLLGRGGRADLRAVLVGFPSDEGVRRNGGREGAADGPSALRQALYRMTPDARDPAFAALLGRVADLGDVDVSGDLERDQEALGDVLAPYLDRGVVPIVLGGGHEVAYGHFLGYVKAGLAVEILNWDAHTDVRPLRNGQAHSGSPFRQALEHPSGMCQRYTVAGLLPHAVAQAHLGVIERQGGRYVFRDDLTPARAQNLIDTLAGPAMVTFDLDAVDGAQAPGVSAPAVDGLDVRLWLDAARHAGRSAHVRSMDVAELNPRHDADGRTARLAARTVWAFLQGLAHR